MKSMPQTMMSAEAISARQRWSRRGSTAHSEAACSVSVSPGISRLSSTVARSSAPAKCVSIATMVTLIDVALRAEGDWSIGCGSFPG